MTYEILGPGALDYLPCQYGTSKLTFRGPQRVLEGPYVAFLGGTMTFGKYIEQPYPLLAEHLTGVTSVNFGQVNAGLDVFSKDATILAAARGAQITVLEVLGAGNMSNCFYRVHPRRNDRFLHALPDLTRLFPEVDFTQFAFTQHMLRYLHLHDVDRFDQIGKVLQKTWVRRMRRLLGQLSPEVILVRAGTADPASDWPLGNGPAPVLVTDEMLDRLGPSFAALVDVPAATAARPSQGMAFSMIEEGAARAVPQPTVHAEIAQSLRPVLDRLM